MPTTLLNIANWLGVINAIGITAVNTGMYIKTPHHERRTTIGLIAMILLTLATLIAAIITTSNPVKLMGVTRLIIPAALTVNIISQWTSPSSATRSRSVRSYLVVGTVLIAISFTGLAIISLLGH